VQSTGFLGWRNTAARWHASCLPRSYAIPAIRKWLPVTAAKLTEEARLSAAEAIIFLGAKLL